MNSRLFDKRKTACGVISVMPMPSPEELKAFYAQVYYQKLPSATYSVSYSEEELAHRRLRAELLLFALAQAGVSGERHEPRMLEIGCGEGFLLQAAKERGYLIKGVDFSDHGLRKFHPELLVNVEVGDAYKILDRLLGEGEIFDICVMQNVLEHVIDPEALLKKVRRILGSNGIVMVTVPNDFSPVQKRLVEKGLVDHEYWFHPPQHLHYFNVDTIKPFAAKCGFEVEDAFADFPIDFFLFHPGSNYVQEPAQGKGAHQARIMLDLLLAERGLGAYHAFCRAVTACGAGRNVTVSLRPLAGEDG